MLYHCCSSTFSVCIVNVAAVGVLTCCAHENWLLGLVSLHVPEDGACFTGVAGGRPDNCEPAGMDLPFLGMQ